MEVAFLGASNLEYYGGVSAYIRETVPLLQCLGINVSTFVYNSVDENVSIEAHNVPFINIPNLKMLSYALMATLKASISNVDIIHYHCSINAWASYLNTKPVVVTIHGNPLIVPGYYRPFKKRLYILLERYGLKRAAKVTTVTPKLSWRIKKLYGVKAEYIPHGATIKPLVNPDLIQGYGIKGSDYILFLGRLTPEKGIDVLLEAYKKSSADFKLVIAGDTDDKRYLEYLRSKTSPGVIFTGKVTGRLKAELLSNTLLFVSPMKVSGLPLTVLEAMSYAKCVVASNADLFHGSYSNPAYEYAWVLNNNSDSELTSIFDNLHKHIKLIENIGIRSKVFVKEHHSWEYVANKFSEIYKNL